MEKTSSVRAPHKCPLLVRHAGWLRLLAALLLLTLSSSMLAGCPPPPHRSTPPAPPKPPGVWIPVHHAAPMV